MCIDMYLCITVYRNVTHCIALQAVGSVFLFAKIFLVLKGNSPMRLITVMSVFFLLVCGMFQVSFCVSREMMLPEVYDENCEVTGWLMSEKLDGVRGYWDGDKMWSKNGKDLKPPDEFVRGLPGFPLEGELWGGHNAFEKTVSIVMKQKAHDGWRQLRFGIFDVPEASGRFIQRMEIARDWFEKHPTPYAFVIPQLPVRNAVHLQEELQRVLELGGEGLIVREPDAVYTGGRSAQVLKVKKFQDAEAVVVGHLPGQGRNFGRLGALLVELPDGLRFKIGTGFSDEERDDPPPLNEVITFKYFGYHSSGIPRFPSFLRIRRDKDLLQ